MGLVFAVAAVLVALWVLWSFALTALRSGRGVRRPAPSGRDARKDAAKAGGKAGDAEAEQQPDLFEEEGEVVAVTVQATETHPLLFGQLEEYLTDEERGLRSRFDEDDTFAVLDGEGGSLFRIVNADESGRFDPESELESELPGVHLFLEPGEQGRDMEALDAMVTAAHWLADACAGRCLDGDGNPLSDQALGNLRARVRRMMRQGQAR